MIFSVVADVSAPVFFFEAADAVHQLRCAGHRPWAGEGFRVAHVRPEFVAVVEFGDGLG